MIIKMKRDPSLVRIIGYTDDAGTPPKNAALAKARAEATAAALAARGVPPGRIIALGRATPDSNLTTAVGSRSSNRRVEFEAGFIGETAE